jgi:tRNA (cmo5U34)-methyltransferase
MSQEFHDAYHEPLTARGSAFPLRFVVGFKKSFNTRNNNFSSVSDNLQNETGKQISFDYVTQSLYPENKPNKSWQFKGENVKNFQKIAETNIQDYEAIIEKCLSIAKRKFPNKGNRIVDIGSARGYTLEKFYNAGYTNLFGIDNSQEMLDNSFKKATLILSEIFPDKLESIDMAIANWTLHFIQNRKEYIQSIYDSLQEGGVFVLSDKVTSPKDIHDMYHDFKRKNGLTEEQIREKESSIVGVLVPYPLEWYFTTLQEIGFKDISIIDAGFSFVTIYCTK